MSAGSFLAAPPASDAGTGTKTAAPFGDDRKSGAAAASAGKGKAVGDSLRPLSPSNLSLVSAETQPRGGGGGGGGGDEGVGLVSLTAAMAALQRVPHCLHSPAACDLTRVFVSVCQRISHLESELQTARTTASLSEARAAESEAAAARLRMQLETTQREQAGQQQAIRMAIDVRARLFPDLSNCCVRVL